MYIKKKLYIVHNVQAIQIKLKYINISLKMFLDLCVIIRNIILSSPILWVRIDIITAVSMNL